MTQRAKSILGQRPVRDERFTDIHLFNVMIDTPAFGLAYALL